MYLVGCLAGHGEGHRLLLKQGVSEGRHVAGHLDQHRLALVQRL